MDEGCRGEEACGGMTPPCGITLSGRGWQLTNVRRSRVAGMSVAATRSSPPAVTVEFSVGVFVAAPSHG